MTPMFYGLNNTHMTIAVIAVRNLNDVTGILARTGYIYIKQFEQFTCFVLELLEEKK